MAPRQPPVTETEQANTLVQQAMAYIGVKASVASLQDWNLMPSVPTEAIIIAWLAKALRSYRAKRDEARALAISYYRLVRVIETGRLPHWSGFPDEANLSSLRQDFQDRLTRASGGAIEPPYAMDPSTDTYEPSQRFTEAPSVSSDEPLAVDDELAQLERQIADEEAALERAVEQDLLDAGPRDLASRVELIDTSQPADVVDIQRQQALRDAGSAEAAKAANVAMNGTRAHLALVASGDDKIIGYARVSNSGHPCYFCAALISRGVVYASKASAGTRASDGKEYHDNCNCSAIPVFSMKQYNTSETFQQNRDMKALWLAHGKGGDLKDWRKFFTQQERLAAQAAA